MRPCTNNPSAKKRRAAVSNTANMLSQALLACFAFTLVIAALLWPIRVSAESRNAVGSASASIDFRIVVPAFLRVTPMSQPQTLHVTEGDITRGYVEITAGSAVKMTTNSKLGYLLIAVFDQQLLTGIEVWTAGRFLYTTSGSGSMHMTSEYAVDRIVSIDYRLHLAQGVRAGSYHWPVALQFSLGAV